jgi:DNA ligase D-like protein (predicted ligase)
MEMNPLKPMLAVSGQPFNRVGWIFEPKIDGTRCITTVAKDVRLQNRRLVDITYRYPEVVGALAHAAREYVLDGEITVFVKGRPSFRALAGRDHQVERMKIEYLSRAMPVSYVVFDILYANGESVMDRPLRERKEILHEVLQEGEIVSIVDSFPEKGEDYFQAALKMGIEGVVAKRLDSQYLPGIRSQDWIKIKRSLTIDLVVGGYIPGNGDREPYFGGLLMGAYDHGQLVYVGRAGSGFALVDLQEITSHFLPRIQSPFSNPPPTKDVKWVEPNLVVQVTALEVTHDGHLRAPVFLRTRGDKDPQECTIDQLN